MAVHGESIGWDGSCGGGGYRTTVGGEESERRPGAGVIYQSARDPGSPSSWAEKIMNWAPRHRPINLMARTSRSPHAQFGNLTCDTSPCGNSPRDRAVFCFTPPILQCSKYACAARIAYPPAPTARRPTDAPTTYSLPSTVSSSDMYCGARLAPQVCSI